MWSSWFDFDRRMKQYSFAIGNWGEITRPARWFSVYVRRRTPARISRVRILNEPTLGSMLDHNICIQACWAIEMGKQSDNNNKIKYCQACLISLFLLKSILLTYFYTAFKTIYYHILFHWCCWFLVICYTYFKEKEYDAVYPLRKCWLSIP